MNLDEDQKTVLRLAFKELDTNRSSRYLDMLMDDNLRRALDSLKGECYIYDSEDNTHLAEALVLEEDDDALDIKEVPNVLLQLARRDAKRREEAEGTPFKRVYPANWTK